MDFDTFCKMMDKFLLENHVQLLIDLPAGTLDAKLKDNTGLGGAVQFYLLLRAIPEAVANFGNALADADAEALSLSLADLVRKEIEKAVKNVAAVKNAAHEEV